MSTLTDLLKSIPPKWRQALNWVYALVVAGTGIAKLAGFEVPVENWEQILLVIGGYLGVQSAVNVSTSTEDTVQEFYRIADRENKG